MIGVYNHLSKVYRFHATILRFGDWIHRVFLPSPGRSGVFVASFFRVCDVKHGRQRKHMFLGDNLEVLIGWVHPQKLTWNLEMMVSNRNLLFQGSIFRFHVCFGGCRWWWLVWLFEIHGNSFRIKIPTSDRRVTPGLMVWEVSSFQVWFTGLCLVMSKWAMYDHFPY